MLSSVIFGKGLRRPNRRRIRRLDKAAPYLRSILLPVPTERTKAWCWRAPASAICWSDPLLRSADPSILRPTARPCRAARRRAAARLVPALAGMPVTAAYAGLRPASEHKDYQIRAHAERRWITVGGIRSTGLTGALGRRGHVWSLYEGLGPRHTAAPAPVWPRMPNIAESIFPAISSSPGYGDVTASWCNKARDRGGPDRPIRAMWRAQAEDPGDDGALSGVLLQRPSLRHRQGLHRDAGETGRRPTSMTDAPTRSSSCRVAIRWGRCRRALAPLWPCGSGASTASRSSSGTERRAASPAIADIPSSAGAKSGRILSGPVYARRLRDAALGAVSIGQRARA